MGILQIMRRKKNDQGRVNEGKGDESEALRTKRRMRVRIMRMKRCEGKKMKRIEMDEISLRLQ